MINNVLDLLVRIQEIQEEDIKNGSEGVFLSVRSNKFLGIRRKDNNIFFTALILFTLRQYEEWMTTEELAIVAQIKRSAISAFSKYTDTAAPLRLYNFWKKEAGAHFPGGNLLHRFRYFKLPDDIDDTALCWLATNYQRNEVVLLKDKVIQHAAYVQRIPFHLPAPYRSLRVYSSWFGKKMPIEADVCVVSNLMYLFLESGEPLNEVDKDNLEFIKRVINRRDYRLMPFQIAPNYGKPLIVYYHLVRLVTAFPLLFEKEVQLLKDDYVNFHSSEERNSDFEQLILQTCGYRLGIIPLNIILLTNKSCIDFYWFSAGMLSTWENRVSQRLAPGPLFHLRFSCEAYYLALVLEHSLEQRRASLS